MPLTTTVEGVWALQALLGIESMPTALRLKPFIPSVHQDLVVETTAGPVPLQQTAEYLSLAHAGVIDDRGRVDDVVRDWMTVIGRADRQVMLVVRRPDGELTNADGSRTPTVHERVLVVCRHKRWMAMIARDGHEMVIDAVGESDDPATQMALMSQPILAAFGDAPPADIDGINIPAELLQTTMERCAGHGRQAVIAAMGRLGLQPAQAEIVAAAARPDESAMAVVSVIDHGISYTVHDRVLTVADTEYGRVSLSTTASADGKKWMSIWPTHRDALQTDLADLLATPRAA
ncbi:ESX secretion-associated protein EspG [Mycobacterium sp. GA-2829]|uniref:ESX secretion-associated protein EspG n=1 Tax=Mycobacterium sp. GA-2829 TaxID=1772283 RepID=UPI00074013D6|nr:ESX secretion-associated protein EspG [Mycobacterium sp. GA-2829]KUI36217.1 hypothetical protein AU194_16000 [Mycobacterium sp. GA-2829]